MLSPAKHHLARFYAKQNRTDGDELNPNTTAYEMQLLQLNEDKQKLKGIQSLEAKIELKKSLVTKYDAWIEGVLESNNASKDDVFTTIMIWYLDIGDLEKALPLVTHALTHKLELADQYKRQTATLIAEELANTSIKLIERKESVSPELLEKYITLLTSEDMPDQVRAKLHKAWGLSLIEQDKPQAVIQLKRAIELDDKCGVKKRIETLERELKQN